MLVIEDGSDSNGAFVYSLKELSAATTENNYLLYARTVPRYRDLVVKRSFLTLRSL